MKKLLPVYCLLGEDHYRRRRYLAGIKDRLSAGENDSLNYEYLLAEEADAARVLDAVRTPGWDLFAGGRSAEGPSRLVVVDGAESFSPDQWRKLADYLADPDPGSCLVFLVSKPVKKWSGKKYFSENSLVAFSPLRGARLRKWVAGEAERQGLVLTRRQVEECALTAGDDLGAVAAGLERLSIYRGGPGKVTDRELRELVGTGREGTVFTLAELAATRKPGEAIALLNHLLDENDEPIRFFALIAGSIRKLWLGVEVWERAKDPRAACAKAGVRYYQEQFLRQVKAISSAEIPYWYRRLVEADRALKRGAKDPRLVLERLLIELAGSKESAAAG